MANAFDAIAEEAAASNSSPGAQAIAQAYQAHQRGASAADYGAAAGTVGGTAACAATGYGAAVAGICGVIGGAIGGFVASLGSSLFGGGETDEVPGIMQDAFLAAVRAAQDAVGEKAKPGGNIAANSEIAKYANDAAYARRVRYTAVHQASTGGVDWYNGGTAAHPGPDVNRQVFWWGPNGLRATWGLERFRNIWNIGPTAHSISGWEGVSARTSDLANAVIAYIAKRPQQAAEVNKIRNAPGPDKRSVPSPTKSSGPGFGTFALIALAIAAVWKRKAIVRVLHHETR